ncbi:MAG TPA: CopD family protein [Afifellaceae bacterium]|nr:CopD family protein [Afifellaceae bacterium]
MEAATAWLKIVHFATLLVWAGSLFYLPALMAAHARTADTPAFMRLRHMTRFTFLAVASPAAILAIISGSLLIVVADVHGGWLVLKLAVVALMAAFHTFCGSIVAEMREPPVRRSPAALAWLVGVPALLVPATFYLVLGKPL